MSMRKPRLTMLAVALLFTGAIITFSALRSGPIIAAAAAGVPANDHDGHGCGARGTYGYTGFGNTFEPNPFNFPAGVLSTNGTITLDGNGNWMVHEVEVVNGQVVNPAATFGGTYTLNPDCTFAAMILGVPGPVFVGVVVDRGNQIRAMGTTPGEQVNYVSTVRIKTEKDSE